MSIKKSSTQVGSNKKFGLSHHYNASQLRMDTWNRLKVASKNLAKQDPASRDFNASQECVKQFLELLTPIESYFAFPGSEVSRQLIDLFERKDFAALSEVVAHVVRLLVSEAYRNRAKTRSAFGRDSVDGRTSHPVVRTEQRGGPLRPYFELLFVDDLPRIEEQELHERMLECAKPGDNFVYDMLTVRTFEDAIIAVLFNHNIQACIIRYSFPFKSEHRLDILQRYVSGLEEAFQRDEAETELGPILGGLIKQLRPELDLYLVTDAAVEEIAGDVYRSFRRVFYRQEDYYDLHLSILRGIRERFRTPFFSALKEYSQRPTGVFHAMPISRGNSIFRSHWIQEMGEFYGRNIFLAETSATTGGLDSLLQPTGPLREAQELAAKTFGASKTFFVTNGTSTGNKIVLQALIQPGDIVLIDRDCHKSHHYGLVLSGAYPIYLDSYPVEQYSMYGAVPLKEIKRRLLELKKAGRLSKVKMLLLTNCTFDGLVYNVEQVMEEVLAIKPDMIFMWDEAWFGFAYFTPIYRQRTAMYNAARLSDRYQSQAYRERYRAFREKFDKLDQEHDETWLDQKLLPDPDQIKIRVYATQSTHKKLSALRQGGMIHVFDEEFKRKVEDSFHEAYMTHTSTSPNYQILASLDMARRQAEFEGFELVQKSVELAMTLRAKITDHPLLQRYFDVLTVKDFIPKEYRPSGIEQFYDPKRGWTQVEEAWSGDDFILDPTHITLYIGKTGIDGDTFKGRYLMDQFGIQINKTSRNTVLFMTNIGTTRGSAAFLIGVLLKIARQLELGEKALNPIERKIHGKRVKSLTEELPPLPDFSHFHTIFRPNVGTLEGDMRSAFFMSYDEAACEFLKLDGSVTKELQKGREVVSAAFVIPYPPGFPILVPGQVISQEILDFMNALDVSEIHGYRPELGLRVFTQEAISAVETKRRRVLEASKLEAKDVKLVVSELASLPVVNSNDSKTVTHKKKLAKA